MEWHKFQVCAYMYILTQACSRHLSSSWSWIIHICNKHSLLITSNESCCVYRIWAMCLHVCVSGVCVSVGVTPRYDSSLPVHCTMHIRWMTKSMMSLMGRGIPCWAESASGDHSRRCAPNLSRSSWSCCSCSALQSS